MHLRPKQSSRRQKDERGVVLVAVLAISIVLVLFSTAAVTETVDGVNQAAVATKQVNSTDAAEAGLQYEISQLDAATQGGGGSFACPASATLTSSGAFSTTYALSYATASGSTPASTPTSAWTSCTGSITLAPNTTYFFKSFGTTTSPAIGSKTLESAVFVPAGTSYAVSGLFPETLYAGVDVLGNGNFKLTGGNTYSGFLGLCTSDWVFGGNYYSAGIPVPALQGGVSVPTTFDGACAVSGNLYMNNSLGLNITGGSTVGGTFYNGVGGNVYDTGPTTISGGATVGGDVWSDGAVNMSGGGAVGGNIYSADPLLGVTLTGGTEVGGSAGIASAGPVTLTNGPSVVGGIEAGSLTATNCGTVPQSSYSIGGSVYSGGPVTISSCSVNGSIYSSGAVTLTSATVKGNVYSTGAVTVTGGTYQNIYADGPVTINGGTVNGTIYSSGGFTLGNAGPVVGTVEDEGGTITYLAKASGPLDYSGAVIVPWPNWDGPTTTSTTIPAGWPLPYTYTAPAMAAVTSIVATQMITAATSASGGSNNGGSSVPFPSLTYGAAAWLDNTAFCGSATPCTTSTMNLVTNNDCNVTTTSGYITTLDPNSVWQVVANMEQPGAKPTVIQTDCQFTWADSYKGYSLKLYNNLAIFDTAGFDFSSSFSGMSSGDGKSHQFYAIVPSTPGVNLLPPLGPVLAPASYPAGEATCNLVTGPDIMFNGPLTDGLIQDFLYTPANVCSNGGAGTINGRIYAGEMFDGTSNVNITASNITPWSVVTSGTPPAGAVTGPGTPVVQSVLPS